MLKKIWADPVWSKVISTGVILIIGAIGSYFIGWLPFRQDIPQKTLITNQPLSNTTNTTIQDRVFLREKSVGELNNSLDNLPPLQKESIFKNSYMGQWVHWEGRVTYIQSVTVRPGFLVTVRTDGEYRASHLWLPTSWREKVENLRIGDLIAFEGKIDGIYVGDISLTDASFIMFEPKK